MLSGVWWIYAIALLQQLNEAFGAAHENQLLVVANVGIVSFLVVCYSKTAKVCQYLFLNAESIWRPLDIGTFRETSLGFETAVPDALYRMYVRTGSMVLMYIKHSPGFFTAYLPPNSCSTWLSTVTSWPAALLAPSQSSSSALVIETYMQAATVISPTHLPTLTSVLLAWQLT